MPGTAVLCSFQQVVVLSHVCSAGCCTFRSQPIQVELTDDLFVHPQAGSSRAFAIACVLRQCISAAYYDILIIPDSLYKRGQMYC